jgi:hypothetical protein
MRLSNRPRPQNIGDDERAGFSARSYLGTVALSEVWMPERLGDGHGTPVYAACDGLASYAKDSHGGEGIYIRTAHFDYQGQQISFRLIIWHLCGDTDPQYPSPIPLDGKQYPVKAGDLIGHADNTGAPFETTGYHLHFGLQAVAPSGLTMNADNGFDSCLDPTPYFAPPDGVKIAALEATETDPKQQSILAWLVSFLIASGD